MHLYFLYIYEVHIRNHVNTLSPSYVISSNLQLEMLTLYDNRIYFSYYSRAISYGLYISACEFFILLANEDTSGVLD